MESSGKICFFCGASCAGQPRGKDPRGRYYHKACMEAARHPEDEPAPDASGEPGFAADADGGMLSEIFEDAPKPSGQPCPQCGTALMPQAVICTNCGYNTQSGSSLAVKVAVNRGSSRPVWPLVVGVICVLLGVGALGLAALDVVGVASGAYGIMLMIGMVIRILLALYLLVGGVQLLKRDTSALTTLRQWAIAKIVLTTVCGGVAIASLAVIGASLPMEEELGVDMNVVLIAAIALLLGALVWPIFLLIWLNRDAVSEETRHW